LHGQNFLTTMWKLGAEHDELRIVADQVGTPNWTRSLAEATAAIVRRGERFVAERAGLYHLSGAGSASWFEFARAIFAAADHPRVVPITSAEYPTAARRPRRSVLSSARIAADFGVALPHWDQMLRKCLVEAR
jgi:dTDP-4-dehydrorhamnose reductase